MKICKNKIHTYDSIYKECPFCEKEYQRRYRDANKEKMKEYQKIYQKKYIINNKEKLQQYQKEYNQKNKKPKLEKPIKDKQQKYIKKVIKQKRKYTRSLVKQTQNEYKKHRKQKDLLFKLRTNLSALIYMSLKKRGYTKKSKTFELLGADFETVKTHLEQTWFNNYGAIYNNEPVHIDHIIPCASAKTEEELIKLQHYTNLQYLTPKDNLHKKDKIII